MAGIWKKDLKAASFFIGEPIEEKKSMELFNDEKERNVFFHIQIDMTHLDYLKKWRSLKNKKAGGILCEFCKFYTKSLGGHLFYEHGIKAKDYREQKGFTRNHILTSPNYHDWRVNFSKINAPKIFPFKDFKEIWKRNRKKDYRSKEQYEKCVQLGLTYKKNLALGRTNEAARKRSLKHKYPKFKMTDAIKQKISKSVKRFYLNKGSD